MKVEYTVKNKKLIGSVWRGIWLTVSIMLLAATTCIAQRRVTLKQADQLRSGKDAQGAKFDRVIGNVIFTQNKTTIYCDSAYFYKAENAIEAFGRIRITEGDSVTITARKLAYDGNIKKARLREDVVFTKLETATLYTDNLDYDRPVNMAHYFSGGKLVDSINVLTSQKGYYDLNSNLASFKKDVLVTNPDYTMASDSLQYNSRTKVIYFRTETHVVDNDSATFVYNGGQYDTKSRRSDLAFGTAETQEYKLEALGYQLDDIRKIYKLRGNVVMTSKKDDVIIYGQSADYYKSEGLSKVYDNAYAAKITDDNDTLFISADTLVSIESQEPGKKRLLAYHNVKIYKSDLQGVTDSLEYRIADSTVYFYRQPVLWNEGNQMTADSIRMLIKGKTIDRMFLNINAFVINRDSLFNFNQIKGRDMVVEFKDAAIYRVNVQGNGESIFYALDEETAAMTGVNRIICSNITIRFKDGRVNNMSFYVQPEARFIPPHELQRNEETLPGFRWQESEKPLRKDVVKPQIR